MISTAPRGAIFTCSVDDGHPCDARIAEVLDRHGLQATFYVPIHNREGRPVMAPSVLRALDQRFEIGSHTYDHCYLDCVAPEQARQQVVTGKSALEDLLGHAVDGFCYPGGRFDTVQKAVVRRAGFAYARTTVNLCLDAGADELAMPTTIQFYPHARAVYLRNLLRSQQWGRRIRALELALRHPDWLCRIDALFDHACRHSQVFHLWCHGWEIEQLDAWPALDRFLARVASQITPERCVSNGLLAASAYGLSSGRKQQQTGLQCES